MDASHQNSLLAHWLSPEFAAQFITHDWTPEVLYSPGQPGRFEDALTDSGFLELVHMLARGAHPSLRCTERAAYAETRKSSQIFYANAADKDCWASLEALSADCVEGRTLICESVQRNIKSVEGICRRLLRETGEWCAANAYFSPASGRVGLDWHYDCWDVFVLQLAGSKVWRIFTGENELPVDRVDFTAPPRDIPIEETVAYTMTAGDLLYLPRGTWHRPRIGDELSLHLTVGVHRRPRIHLNRWLAPELSQNRAMREYLPPDPFQAGPGDVAKGRLQQEFENYAREVQRILEDPQAVKKYRLYCLQSANTHFPGSSPSELSEE